LALARHRGVMPVDLSAFSHITREIIGAAVEVHRTLGPGLLESTYLQCLQSELGAGKQRFVAQRQIPLVYKGMALDTCPVGLLINFNVPKLIDGVHRLINPKAI
jgi:hypothetical protein